MEKMAQKIVLMMGPPGAGKGTQSARAVKEFGWPSISTGDVFRKHIQEKTPLGQRVSDILASGQLVPDDITLEMLREELSKTTAPVVLLDGFPRTYPQCQALEENGFKVVLAVHFDVDLRTLVERIEKRAKEMGRNDDAPDKFKKRIEVYERDTRPCLAYYQQRGLYRRVDGDQEEATVFQNFRDTLKTHQLM